MFKTQKLEEIPLSKIVPNKINPNNMSSGTFDKLKKSILKFGVMNPLIVRKVNDSYEIIDGEHRFKASKELQMNSLLCKILDNISDDEVAKLIFASTIKGNHSIYDSVDIITKLKNSESAETLSACNLDKGKIERGIKYAKVPNAKITKGSDKKDEKDSLNVKEIKDFKKAMLFFFNIETYKLVEDKLLEVNPKIEDALKIVLGV